MPSCMYNAALFGSGWGAVKTVYSGKTMCIDAEMIGLLKVRKQTTHFPDDGDLDFCKPGETQSLAGL
jgi:hypothetical protein